MSGHWPSFNLVLKTAIRFSMQPYKLKICVRKFWKWILRVITLRLDPQTNLLKFATRSMNAMTRSWCISFSQHFGWSYTPSYARFSSIWSNSQPYLQATILTAFTAQRSQTVFRTKTRHPFRTTRHSIKRTIFTNSRWAFTSVTAQIPTHAIPLLARNTIGTW